MCQKCLTGHNSKPGLIGRRGLLTGALALSVTAPFASRAFAQTTQSSPASPDEAIQRLIDGNARYVANTPTNIDHSVGRVSRAQGQNPFAAVVTCSDSRVVPELIFDQAPGALFVIRVAGNFLNDDGIASLEYAAAVLSIQTVLVLGHSSCGAVGATIKSIEDNKLPPGHLPSLVNAIRPAVYDVMSENPSDLRAAATARNAVLNAKKAAMTGPILAERNLSGTIKSIAGVYEIATGAVTIL